MPRKPPYRTGHPLGYRGPEGEDPQVGVAYEAILRLVEEAQYDHVLAVLAMRRLAMKLEHSYRKVSAVPRHNVFVK